jgi:hypothetical protein
MLLEGELRVGMHGAAHVHHPIEAGIHQRAELGADVSAPHRDPRYSPPSG